MLQEDWERRLRVNYNGFNLTVTTVLAAMLWASGLSAFFFAPATTYRWPLGR